MALPPPQAPTDPTTAAARRRPWLTVLAAVVGIGAGLLIGVVAFGGSDDDDAAVPEGGAADAAAGCQLLANVDGDVPGPGDDARDDEEWSFDGPNVWRLQGASGAFTAAANADRAYRSLGEDGERLWQSYNRFDIDEVNDLLDDLRDACADLGADEG
jgi:hypothetical protein